jgi:hypothetical protein
MTLDIGYAASLAVLLAAFVVTLVFQLRSPPITHFCISGHSHCRDSVDDAAGAFEKSKGLLNNHREKRSVFRFAPLRSLGCKKKGITNEKNVYCLVCD